MAAGGRGQSGGVRQVGGLILKHSLTLPLASGQGQRIGAGAGGPVSEHYALGRHSPNVFTLGGAHRGIQWGPIPPKLTACWGNTDTKQLVPEKGREGGRLHCEYLAV